MLELKLNQNELTYIFDVTNISAKSEKKIILMWNMFKMYAASYFPASISFVIFVSLFTLVIAEPKAGTELL